MKARALRNSRLLVVLALASAGLMLTGPAASAAPVSIDLCALPGTVSLPGPTTVPIWGFGLASTPGDCGSAVASLPGPVLVVDEGDSVAISVTNALPAGHTIAFEMPGIVIEPGATDVPTGATVTMAFTADSPGTYVYQSGGDAGRQEAMGLSGAFIVRSVTTNQAYDDGSTAYDVEAVLVLSAIDPAFNAAPDTFDLLDYVATYWVINGKAYPDTAPGIAAPAGQRVLLRYVNAGFDNTSMTLLGMHQRVVARDAQLLTSPFDASSETIPAGATEDTIATVPSVAPPNPNGFPIYNRQLHVTNGDQNGEDPTPADGGGMLIFIRP